MKKKIIYILALIMLVIGFFKVYINPIYYYGVNIEVNYESLNDNYEMFDVFYTLLSQASCGNNTVIVENSNGMIKYKVESFTSNDISEGCIKIIRQHIKKVNDLNKYIKKEYQIKFYDREVSSFQIMNFRLKNVIASLLVCALSGLIIFLVKKKI